MFSSARTNPESRGIFQKKSQRSSAPKKKWIKNTHQFWVQFLIEVRVEVVGVHTARMLYAGYTMLLLLTLVLYTLSTCKIK